jgi:predicted nucleic acid-binding protein
MSVMVVLIDTNILLDCFISRQPFVDNAKKVLKILMTWKTVYRLNAPEW